MATKDIVFGQQTITIGYPSIGPNSRWNADGNALINPVTGNDVIGTDSFMRDLDSIDAIVYDSWKSGKGTYSVSVTSTGTATFKADVLFPRQSDFATAGLSTDYVQQTHSSIPYVLPQLTVDDVLLIPIKLTGYYTQTPPNYPAAVTVHVYVSSDNFSTKSGSMLGYLHPVKMGEWGVVSVPCSTFSSANGQLISDKFNWLGVRLTNSGSNGSTALTATVAGVYKAASRRPKLIIEFDDAWAGVYSKAFPLMQAAGIPGTICVIASLVGTAGYCTDAQLREMKAAGWNMIVHGETNHTDLGSESAVYADVVANQSYVRSLGDDGLDYVLPQGVLTAYTNAALVSAGIKTSRTTKTIGTSPDTDVAMIAAPLVLLAKPITDAATVSGLVDYIDAAIDQKATAIIYGHNIKDVVTDANQDISTANFTELLSHIAARSGGVMRQGAIDCITQRQWREFVGL